MPPEVNGSDAESDGDAPESNQNKAPVSGLYVPSQWMRIEDKNNGLGDMVEATVFWTKKTMHVTFRRPLKVSNSKTMEL